MLNNKPPPSREEKLFEQEHSKKLEYLKNQFEIAKMLALCWQAMATTGACKMRNTSQGREATEEEKAKGMSMGWRDHSDEEKVFNALETMNIHIHRMLELSDKIYEVME